MTESHTVVIDLFSISRNFRFSKTDGALGIRLDAEDITHLEAGYGY